MHSVYLAFTPSWRRERTEIGLPLCMVAQPGSSLVVQRCSTNESVQLILDSRLLPWMHRTASWLQVFEGDREKFHWSAVLLWNYSTQSVASDLGKICLLCLEVGLAIHICYCFSVIYQLLSFSLAAVRKHIVRLINCPSGCSTGYPVSHRDSGCTSGQNIYMYMYITIIASNICPSPSIITGPV